MSFIYLALDTATPEPSVALGTPDEPGAEVRIPRQGDLSRTVDRIVMTLLARNGVGAAEVAGVVLADGPGSFTGLRIGAAFAKGWCRARRVPLLTAPSLLGAACRAARLAGSPREGAALAAERSGRVVLATYDALRGEVYRAVYAIEPARITVLVPPGLAPAAAPLQGTEIGSTPTVRAEAAHASAAQLLALVGDPAGPAVVADPIAWEPEYGRAPYQGCGTA
jgi:tRNA threonylcarbamoyladenosine biosynthesis protein TsaB